MSVLLITSTGEIVIDLFVNQCPIACENFLKLCTIKYYNGCLLYNVQQNYIMQTGDPTATGQGGTSIQGILEGSHKRCFPDEINPNIKTNKVGYVGMARLGNRENTNQSQFFITLRGEDMEHFGKEYTIFGEVAEGLEVLDIINNLYCDEDGRPYQDVRILHTYVLDDPYPNPSDLVIPPSSPTYEYPPEEKVKRRIPYEVSTGESTTSDGRSAEEIEESIREKEAKSRAIVLEMVGDLPDAEVKPPDEVLFVCKLNPVTRDDDLRVIFSRFGMVKSCEIIRDHKTGDSLNYAFIEFETEEACIEAYNKMNNAIIDDRRIKVDFSQSVSKLWNRFLLRPRQGPASTGIKKEHHKPQSESQKQAMAVYGHGREVDSQPMNKSKEVEREDRYRPRDQREVRDSYKERSGDNHRDDRRDKYEKDRNHGKRGDRDRDDRDYRRDDKGRERERSDRQRDRSRSRDKERGRDKDDDRYREKDRDQRGHKERHNRDSRDREHREPDRRRRRSRS
jgi:peptidyl-prolyl cis-trans isomerase-like 4